MGISNGEGRRAAVLGPRRTAALALTLLLCLSIACHSSFLSKGSAFVTEGDSLRQMAAATVLLDRTLEKGDSLLWSWEYGLGGDLFSGLSFYYSTSPLYYLEYGVRAALGAAGDVEATLRFKLCLSIARLTLICFLMYLLLSREGFRPCYCLLGGMFYGVASRYMYFALVFDFMTTAWLFPPLILMALYSWRKKGKWLGLIATVGLMAACNFYFAFVDGVFTISAGLILPLADRPGWRRYLGDTGKLALIGAGGLLLAGAAFIPSVAALLQTDRLPEAMELSLIPERSFVSSLWHNLYNWNTVLTFPLLLAAALPGLAGGKNRDALCRTALTIFWLLMWCAPLGRSVMNGLSYPSDRFFYLVSFSAAYALPSMLDELEKRKRRWGFVPGLLTALCLGLFAARKFEPDALGQRALYYPAIGAALICIAVTARASWKGKMSSGASVGMVAAAFVGLACVSAASLKGSYTPAEAAELLTGDASTVEALNQLEDQADVRPARIHDARTEQAHTRTENRSFVTGVPSAELYMSMTTQTVHRWFKRTAQVRSYMVASHFFRGFDDRLFLETAWNMTGKLTEPEAAQSYPSECWEASGRDPVCLRLKNQTGFDLWYDTELEQAVWEALPVAQRDALLLQTAAVAGGKNSFDPQSNPATVEITRRLDDCVLTDCTLLENGALLVPREGTICVSLPQTQRAGEYLVCLYLKEQYQGAFVANVNGKECEKFNSEYPFGYPAESFAFQLSGNAGQAVITLSQGCYLDFQLRVDFNSYAYLQEWVAARNACNLENLTAEGNRIQGSVRCPGEGILALSMPLESGWRCYVDGVKTDLIQVNGVFAGIRLQAGEHQIQLVYLPQSLLWGGAATLLALAAIGAVWIVQAESRKKLPESGLRKSENSQ